MHIYTHAHAHAQALLTFYENRVVCRVFSFRVSRQTRSTGSAARCHLHIPPLALLGSAGGTRNAEPCTDAGPRPSVT